MIKKVFGIVGSVLTGLLVAIEIITIIFIIVMKMSGGVPSIFGYNVYVIVSPSMKPELEVGDVIISREYDGGELHVGDVVTYLGKEGDLQGKMVTHEVVRVDEETKRLTTKGLANESEDPEILYDDVRSVFVYKTVVIGAIYSIVTTTWGFILLIALPLVIMIATEVVHLVKLTKKQGEENEDAKNE